MNDDPDRPELDSRPQSRREWSGWLRSLVLPLGLVVAIVGGLLWYQARGSNDTADDGYGTIELPAAKNTTGQSPAATAGRAAPDFLLQTIDGKTLRLSDLQGRPLLVNFWATWCASCRVEMPQLVETFQKYQGSGLALVAVDLREADSQVSGFVDEFDLPFTIALDHHGQVAQAWHIGGPTEGLPTSYFIDRNGVVQKVVLGTLTAKTLNEGLGLILDASN